MSYPASVFGPSVRNQLLRTIVLLALIPAALFLMACGHSSSSSTTTTGPAPTFTSTAPTLAREGVQYTYDITTTTTDSSTVTYKVTSGPSEATIDGSTLKWTPTHAESRTSNAFTITATTSANGTATQSFSITPNGNIDATAVDHAVTGTGLQNYPQNLSASVVEALIPDGKGGYNTIKGSGDNAGNFNVPNVPVTSFWLHVRQPYFGQTRDNYIWTNASDVDAGQFLPGRPDVKMIAAGQTVNTNVTLSVAPKTGDTADWVSSDASASAPSLPATTNPLIATFNQTGGLIDSSKGDRAFLVHYTADSNGVNHIVEAKAYTDITQTDGGTTNLSGTLSAFSGSTTDPVIKITQFDRIYFDLTNSPVVQRSFTLEDVGYGGTEGGGTGVPLITADLSATATDVDLGSIPYGLVTSSGVPYYTFEDYGLHTVKVGSTTIDTLVGSLVISNTAPTSASSIVPVLSTPQNPSIDGLNFFHAHNNVTLTPLIAWNPPATGVPTSYELIVIDAAAPATTVHYFFTNGNSVNVPSGVLQPGHTYVFELQAFLSQLNTFTAAPFRNGTSVAITTIGSAAMTITNPSGKPAASAPTAHYRIAPDQNGGVRVTKLP